MKDDTTCSIDKIYPGVFISLSDTLVQYLLLYSRKPVYSFKNGCDCENIVWVNFRKEIKLSTESQSECMMGVKLNLKLDFI